MRDVKLNIELKQVPKDLMNHPLFTYRGEIVYGVPQETSQNRLKDPKSNSSITNAELLAIHEHGSPIRNLPPRQLLEPVFNKHRDDIDKEMAKVAGRLLEGDTDGADQIMERLAFRLESWCKAYFTSPDNEWAPNAESTIKAWLRKTNRGTKVVVTPDMKKPLIDTAELRKAIRGVFLKEGIDNE